MSARAIVAALEALEAGNLGELEAILLGALEDGPRERRFRCPVCGLGLEWPGLVEAHSLNVHGVEAAA